MTHRSDAGPAPVLALKDISKSFGAVRALRDVSLELFPGEVHALAGENGAGKSTLIKTLAGVHRPDAGQVLLDGEPTVFHGPADARDAGIAVIYQEPTLFPDLSIAENIFMGRQPRRALGRIDHKATHASTLALMKRLGVELDPDRPARGLSIADQQIVEIAKALSFDARVLIMDEPTAALTGSEVARLFGVVRTLREQGSAVLFISHRLEEIFRICQQVTTLRDGALISSEPIDGMTEDDLVRRMVGRDLDELYPKQDVDAGEVALSVRRLTREGVFTDVSFDVRRGEIVGLAGLVGAGRTEVARAVFGVDRWDAGEVEIDGRKLTNGAPSTAMAAGLALVPEDRRAQGLVMDMSIERNIGLTGLRTTVRAGLMDPRAERSRSLDWAVKLQVKYARIADTVNTLSGGNQQKVVLAKWLATGPKVLIVDEPTRGIDVGTKAEVHRLLSQLAADGVAVLMISSDLPEILGMADRVLVMHEGRLTAEIPRSDATEETVMAAATGEGSRVTVTAPNPAPAAEVPKSSGTRLVDRVFKMRELAILVVFLVMIVITQIGNSDFLSEQGIKDLLLNATILVLVATGQSLVVITRNVDLSVGSTLGISAFAAGTYLQGGGNSVVAVALAVLLGIGCGLVNGLLVSLGQVPALVVTLGTLYIIRGIDSIWVGSRQITAAGLPDGFIDFGSGGLSAVPWLAMIALVVLIVTAYYLKHFGSGRELYALGSNPEAARLAGIPVRKRILAAYTFCGALAGLAGALYLARFGNVDSGTGNGYELTVVSAVVVGGVVFTGGSGSVYGAALGALLLTSINSVLPALGVSSVWVLAINGILLILAIAVDRIVALRVATALKKRNARHG